MESAFTALSGLKPEEKKRVLLWLWEKLDIQGSVPAATPSVFSPASAPAVPMSHAQVYPPGATPTAKAFIVQKAPQTDVERVTCLGYFLANYKSLPQFKTRDLSALN